MGVSGNQSAFADAIQVLIDNIYIIMVPCTPVPAVPLVLAVYAV